MVTSRRARHGQLLLSVALLFGIATMHTMGHPSSAHGPRHGPAPAPVVADAHAPPGGEAAAAVPHRGHAKHLPLGAKPAEPAQYGQYPALGAQPAAHAEATRHRPPGTKPVEPAEPAKSAQDPALGAERAAHADPAAPAKPAHRAAASLGGASASVPDAPAGRGFVDSQGPGHDGMDPAAVCLAVLGGWGVALLVARLVARRPADQLLADAHARLLRALWPDPPPPRTVLARLSVLRI
jgi:hypothetical protein